MSVGDPKATPGSGWISEGIYEEISEIILAGIKVVNFEENLWKTWWNFGNKPRRNFRNNLKGTSGLEETPEEIPICVERTP